MFLCQSLSYSLSCSQGQVPPYAMPQITQFSIQEAIIKTVEAAVDVHGLKALSGSDGQVEVKEKVEDMVKGYKLGDCDR